LNFDKNAFAGKQHWQLWAGRLLTVQELNQQAEQAALPKPESKIGQPPPSWTRSQVNWLDSYTDKTDALTPNASGQP
jgi:hypothetical protein